MTNGEFDDKRSDSYVLIRPTGALFFGPATHNECFKKLLDSQSMSTTWALMHEGWVWIHSDDQQDFTVGWRDALIGMTASIESDAANLGYFKAKQLLAFYKRCQEEK